MQREDSPGSSYKSARQSPTELQRMNYSESLSSAHHDDVTALDNVLQSVKEYNEKYVTKMTRREEEDSEGSGSFQI